MFLLYADDNNILYVNSDTKTILKTINMEMSKIIEWFKSNKLQVNLSKTFDMLFHTRHKRVNIYENSIVIDGNIIIIIIMVIFKCYFSREHIALS